MSEEPKAETREERPLTRKTIVYRLIRTACILYLGLRHRMKVEGLEHLPRKGGALIVSNHQSYLDIPLIAAAVPRHVSFVARRSLADSKPLAFIMSQCGATLIDRGVTDRAALREIAAHLEAGDVVAIYPEGTRTHDGSVGEFKGGVKLIARKSKVPMVPASIHGSYRIWPRGRKRPGPGPIGIRFAPPIDPREGDAVEAVRKAVIQGMPES